MRDFFGSVRFKILVAVLMVMVGFMIAAIYTGGTASIVTQVVNLIVEPVQRLSASATGGVSDFFAKYFHAAKTYEENERLQQEVSELRKQLVDYEKMKHEYEQLQKIGDVREQHQDLVISTASVIERDHANPFYTFTVDKGSMDGIALRDPVMTEDGLVGYVEEVGLSSAKVMTLLNINMHVGASNSATRDVGNVTGTLELAREGLCRMEYLPRDSETAPGNIIVTSGGSLFPKGLVIGMVKEITTSSRGNSIEATITPAADILGLKDVFIITEFEGQGQD